MEMDKDGHKLGLIFTEIKRRPEEYSILMYLKEVADLYPRPPKLVRNQINRSSPVEVFKSAIIPSCRSRRISFVEGIFAVFGHESVMYNKRIRFIKTDPGERENLSNQYLDIVKLLQRQIKEWLNS